MLRQSRDAGFPDRLLAFLVVGLIAGWLGGQIMRARGFGLAGNLVVGVLGALLGGFLFDLLGLRVGGDPLVSSLVTAVVGAVVLLVLLDLVD